VGASEVLLESLCASVEEAVILTDYAVASRYPGDVEPVTPLEYERALHLAEVVLTWARRIVGPTPQSGHECR